MSTADEHPGLFHSSTRISGESVYRARLASTSQGKVCVRQIRAFIETESDTVLDTIRACRTSQALVAGMCSQTKASALGHIDEGVKYNNARCAV